LTLLIHVMLLSSDAYVLANSMTEVNRFILLSHYAALD
jgi:hypothetical protein